MKVSLSPSKPANLRDSLHQHLHLYALAASAAGVSLLAMAQPVEAEIIYTPVQVTIGPNQYYDLDVNNDGIVDFTIRNKVRSTTSKFFSHLFVQDKAPNAVAAHRVNYGFPWAYALWSGIHIGKNRRFSPSRVSMAWLSGTFGATTVHVGGSWGGAENRYLGLRFKIDGKTHYGWAQLSVQYPFGTATLTGYAYETIPNKAIIAGQEQDQLQDQNQDKDEGVRQPGPAALTNPAPPPATLGLLAKGAPALCIWRRSEDQSLACERK